MFNSSNKSLRRQMTTINLHSNTQLDEAQKENPQRSSSKADYMAQQVQKLQLDLDKL